MNDHKVSVAVFWIIKNNVWQILFQKRINTGFADGYYQLPSGHLETTPSESIEEWCIRELREEIGIEVSVKDLELSFCHHSHWAGTKNYLGFFFDIHTYSGEIHNAEPDKCEFLEWIHPEDFADKKIVRYVKENLLDNSGWIFRCETYEKSEDFIG